MENIQARQNLLTFKNTDRSLPVGKTERGSVPKVLNAREQKEAEIKKFDIWGRKLSKDD